MISIRSSRNCLVGAAVFVASLISAPAMAAAPVASCASPPCELDLASVPLYLRVGTPPNILFVLDDSASMSGTKLTDAQAAITSVISSAAGVRMGLATLNSSVRNTEIADMDVAADKATLLSNLASVSTGASASLRSIMMEAGEYLSGNSTSLFKNYTNPQLAVADGGACQQNFVIMVSDSLYDGGSSASPNVGNADGDGNTSWDGGAYGDSFSNTLADVAMKYYETDVNPGLTGELPVLPGVDENREHHINTFAVGFAASGALGVPYGDLLTQVNAGTNPNWLSPGDPLVSGTAAVDDLMHAAINGRGEYFSSASATTLQEALDRTLSSVGSRNSSAGAAAVNTGTLSAESRVYQARFNSSDWSGELSAFLINTSDGSVGSQVYEAGALLDASSWDSDREILTASSGAGVAFRWSSLSSTQQGYLDKGDGNGEKRLNFLRGDRSYEGTDFRQRGSVLGDLVHSAPVYVGSNTSFPYADSMESASYLDFITNDVVGRAAMIYVGSNDGMLHGFDAATGEELIAYLPEEVMPDVAELTSSGYVHRFFVDGEMGFNDVFYSSAWHTVLVGSLRAGGQGYFALDITDPSDFDESNASSLVLWEFTDEYDDSSTTDVEGADLGYSYSQPAIARMADPSSSTSGPWAAIFGNGYNATETDGSASTTGDAVLYIVNIKDGSLIAKISTETGSDEDPTGADRPNGLSSPAPVDFNGDFIVDRIYAGDLFGNLWVFDVSDPDPDNWEVAYKVNNGDPEPLYRAKIVMSAGTEHQPITTRPEVSTHPEGTGVMVYFGTGKYIEVSDTSATNQTTQTFYGVWDEQAYQDFSSGALLAPGLDRSDLQQQAIEKEVYIAASSNWVRVGTSNPVDWDTQKGWYMDLYNTDEGNNALDDNLGERMISNPIVRAGKAIFTTFVPLSDPCGYGGTGWLMELDVFEGRRLDYTAVDVNGDGLFDSADYVTVTLNSKSVTIPASGIQSKVGILPRPAIIAAGDKEYKYFSGTTGAIGVETENPGPFIDRRTSWERQR